MKGEIIIAKRRKVMANGVFFFAIFSLARSERIFFYNHLFVKDEGGSS
jgi:hypothetical protein